MNILIKSTSLSQVPYRLECELKREVWKLNHPWLYFAWDIVCTIFYVLSWFRGF